MSRDRPQDFIHRLFNLAAGSDDPSPERAQIAPARTTRVIFVTANQPPMLDSENFSKPEVAVKRDFASLSPREALRIAIVIEERNAHIYHRLGEMFSRYCPGSPEIASAFYDLANTEREHGIVLTARYLERFGAAPADITEENIQDFIEVPRLRVGDILIAVEEGDVALARRMAFEMALGAERTAVSYYARLEEVTLDPELRALYKEFVAFEQEHTDWAEKTLGQLGPT